MISREYLPNFKKCESNAFEEPYLIAKRSTFSPGIFLNIFFPIIRAPIVLYLNFLKALISMAPHK